MLSGFYRELAGRIGFGWFSKPEDVANWVYTDTFNSLAQQASDAEQAIKDLTEHKADQQ